MIGYCFLITVKIGAWLAICFFLFDAWYRKEGKEEIGTECEI